MLIRQSEIVGDLQYINLLNLVTEGRVICHFSQEKILDALIGLLGSFILSMFLTISQRKFYFFLEQALLEIGHRQTLVTVSSVFNDLANA